MKQLAPLLGLLLTVASGCATSGGSSPNGTDQRATPPICYTEFAEAAARVGDPGSIITLTHVPGHILRIPRSSLPPQLSPEDSVYFRLRRGDYLSAEVVIGSDGIYHQNVVFTGIGQPTLTFSTAACNNLIGTPPVHQYGSSFEILLPTSSVGNAYQYNVDHLSIFVLATPG